MTDLELFQEIYDEAEPITSAGLTPMRDEDVDGYKISVELMDKLEDHLEWYRGLRPAPAEETDEKFWAEEDVALWGAPPAPAGSEEEAR